VHAISDPKEKDDSVIGSVDAPKNALLVMLRLAKAGGAASDLHFDKGSAAEEEDYG